MSKPTLTEAIENFRNAFYKLLHIPQIADWINEALKRLVKRYKTQDK